MQLSLWFFSEQLWDFRTGYSRPWKYPKPVHPHNDDFTQAVWMVLKRCPGRWRSDKNCGMKGSLLRCVLFCIKWNGNQNFMPVNSLFLQYFSSNSCAPKKVQNYKVSFKGVCSNVQYSKKSTSEALDFYFFFPSNNFPSIKFGRPSPKWHWVALGVAGHGWVWLTACWRSRPRPTRSVLGLKGKTNWLCNCGLCGRLVGTGWEVLIWSNLVQRWVEINEGETSVYCGHRGIGRYQFRIFIAFWFLLIRTPDS